MDAWYVYCVRAAGALPVVCAGILPDCAVERVAVGGFSVLASRVPRAVFEQGHAQCCTADPDWMQARVQAHHAVNAAASAAGASLPLAFGALFSDLTLLETWLEARAARLRAALAEVAGQAEWALILAEDAAAHGAWLDVHDPDLCRLAEKAAGAGAGVGFLIARQRDKALQAARTRHLAAVRAALQERLAHEPVALVGAPVAADRPTWNLLAASAAGVAELADDMAAALAPTGLMLRLTGPWPPYAFARAALAEEMEDA